MIKKSLIALALSTVSFVSMANWVGGVSYVNLSDDIGGEDISLGGITGSLGYKIDSESKFTFIPEIRIGTGVGDDTVYGVDVEMNGFIAFSFKGQYQLNESVYLFAAPSYANVEIEASANGYSATEDEWEFGIGAGLGYQFNNSVFGELSYEQFDGTDVFSAGVKFNF